MFKRIISIILSITLLSSLFTPVFAEENTETNLDSGEITFFSINENKSDDILVKIIDGKSYVDIKSLVEVNGGTFSYDTKTSFYKFDGASVRDIWFSAETNKWCYVEEKKSTIVLSNPAVMASGDGIVHEVNFMDAPIVEDGVIYVELFDVLKLMGAVAVYDNVKKQICIYYPLCTEEQYINIMKDSDYFTDIKSLYHKTTGFMFNASKFYDGACDIIYNGKYFTWLTFKYDNALMYETVLSSMSGDGISSAEEALDTWNLISNSSETIFGDAGILTPILEDSRIFGPCCSLVQSNGFNGISKGGEILLSWGAELSTLSSLVNTRVDAFHKYFLENRKIINKNSEAKDTGLINSIETVYKAHNNIGNRSELAFHKLSENSANALTEAAVGAIPPAKALMEASKLVINLTKFVSDYEPGDLNFMVSHMNLQTIINETYDEIIHQSKFEHNTVDRLEMIRAKALAYAYVGSGWKRAVNGKGYTDNTSKAIELMDTSLISAAGKNPEDSESIYLKERFITDLLNGIETPKSELLNKQTSMKVWEAVARNTWFNNTEVYYQTIKNDFTVTATGTMIGKFDITYDKNSNIQYEYYFVDKETGIRRDAYVDYVDYPGTISFRDKKDDIFGWDSELGGVYTRYLFSPLEHFSVDGFGSGLMVCGGAQIALDSSLLNTVPNQITDANEVKDIILKPNDRYKLVISNLIGTLSGTVDVIEFYKDDNGDLKCLYVYRESDGSYVYDRSIGDLEILDDGRIVAETFKGKYGFYIAEDDVVYSAKLTKKGSIEDAAEPDYTKIEKTTNDWLIPGQIWYYSSKSYIRYDVQTYAQMKVSDDLKSVHVTVKHASKPGVLAEGDIDIFVDKQGDLGLFGTFSIDGVERYTNGKYAKYTVSKTGRMASPPGGSTFSPMDLALEEENAMPNCSCSQYKVNYSDCYSYYRCNWCTQLQYEDCRGPMPDCICDEKCVDSINTSCARCKIDSSKCEGIEKTCECEIKCVGEANENCSICSNDIEQCVGIIPECICSMRCDEPNEECLACVIDIEVCKGEEQPVCTCNIKCTEINENCEVCSTDIANCIGEESIICICDTKCKEPNPECMICNTNIDNCIGEEVQECICEVKCDEVNIVTACSICTEDYTQCCGEKEIVVISCICNTKCAFDNYNELCVDCATNIENCKGIDEPVTPTCICETKCTENSISEECEICLQSFANCEGEDAEVEVQLMSKEQIRRTWFNCNRESWVGTCGDYEWDISVYEDLQWDSGFELWMGHTGPFVGMAGETLVDFDTGVIRIYYDFVNRSKSDTPTVFVVTDDFKATCEELDFTLTLTDYTPPSVIRVHPGNELTVVIKRTEVFQNWFNPESIWNLAQLDKSNTDSIVSKDTHNGTLEIVRDDYLDKYFAHISIEDENINENYVPITLTDEGEIAIWYDFDNYERVDEPIIFEFIDDKEEAICNIGDNYRNVILITDENSYKSIPEYLRNTWNDIDTEEVIKVLNLPGNAYHSNVYDIDNDTELEYFFEVYDNSNLHHYRYFVVLDNNDGKINVGIIGEPQNYSLHSYVWYYLDEVTGQFGFCTEVLNMDNIIEKVYYAWDGTNFSELASMRVVGTDNETYEGIYEYKINSEIVESEEYREYEELMQIDSDSMFDIQADLTENEWVEYWRAFRLLGAYSDDIYETSLYDIYEQSKENDSIIPVRYINTYEINVSDTELSDIITTINNGYILIDYDTLTRDNQTSTKKYLVGNYEYDIKLSTN